MTSQIFSYKPPFLAKARKQHVPVTLLSEKQFKPWLEKQPKCIQAQVNATSFAAEPCKTLLLYDKDYKLTGVVAGINDPLETYDVAHTAAYLSKQLPEKLLKSCSFYLECPSADKDTATLSWGLAGYSFDAYKENKTVYPSLLVDKAVDKKRIIVLVEAISIARNMISTPANDLGPAEIEDCVKSVAKKFKATVKVVKDKALIKNNFPLVYTVGEAAAEDDDRRPRLIELNWGNAKHSKLTLVGKGVVFDTGGLNLKPTQHMALMKKDMGGAAHALATAYMVMALNLPVRLKLVIPAVENAVSGPAFRPGDVLKTRKGLTVENTNTDAEGRLILADSLAYACEDKPDLIIDYATLTGSARAALGHDIPGMFSTNEKMGKALQKISFEVQDPVWQMPLHLPYKQHIKSSIADLVNSASIPGDLIYSALFLHSFIEEKQDWIHLDCFAWESTGLPGRPKGGADTGLRAVVSFLEQKYKA